MKKRLIFEVEEGQTQCSSCPFNLGRNCGNRRCIIDCEAYDLSTIKFIGEEYETSRRSSK